MRKASRNPELPAIIIIELNGNMSTKCRAATANVHCDVQNTPPQHTYKLTLGFWKLKMEPAQDTTV